MLKRLQSTAQNERKAQQQLKFESLFDPKGASFNDRSQQIGTYPYMGEFFIGRGPIMKNIDYTRGYVGGLDGRRSQRRIVNIHRVRSNAKS